MNFKEQDNAWDFTSVIDLIHSLSSKAERCTANDTSLGCSSEEPIISEQKQEHNVRQGDLGNFDKVWRYLGQPLNASPPVVTLHPRTASTGTLTGEAGLVDENVDLTVSKGVRWQNEVEGADHADNDQNCDPESLPKLSKSKRKRLRMRKIAEAMKVGTDSTSAPAPTSSENESEVEPQITAPIRSRGSVIREILYGSRSNMQKAGVDSTPALRAAHQITETPKWPIANPRYFLRSSVQQSDRSFIESSTRKTTLINKLREQFVNDRPYLENIGLISLSGTGSLFTDIGVHVFVDASNIMIGFHDSLKISRGISMNSRVHRQPISFHNLSLVLERGRPTAKRILVGSDNFPAVQEAKTIGYETNILDRVHKAKELTPRQKRYSNGNGAASSGSETTAVMYAPEKWVEQAVDEILHLKILESVVDAKEPSTIVLATGDAAEAEYSQGFLKMVERAMGKGWKVELCSFKKNISGAYRKKDFRARWEKQFKIIEMDDFVEELLGVE